MASVMEGGKSWLVCLAFALASSVAAGAVTLRPSPQGTPGATEDGAVAAVFPPWWTGERAAAAAAGAGAILRYGGFRFVVVILPDHAAAWPELRRAGAWLLLDPRTLGLCTGRSTSGAEAE